MDQNAEFQAHNKLGSLEKYKVRKTQRNKDHAPKRSTG